MKTKVAFAVMMGLMLVSGDALAQKKSPLRTDQVRGEYVPPKDETKHKVIYDRLRELQILERLRELLSPLRLPRRLTLKVDSCDGVANAYYEDDTVTICYEYFEYIVESAPKDPATGAPHRDALIGPTVDVFLHEVGHAVFDMLEVPVFGREEDAADLFSAYVMLHFAPADARRLIASVAFLGATDAKEAQQKAPELKDYADSHGLPAQRYFNVLCMAYGFDSKAYADAISRAGLPADRAEGCADEYEVLERAFRKLIMPYVDQAKLRKVVRDKIRFDWAGPPQ